MGYQIIVNEKQARIISSALDVYARIQGGQFKNAFDRFEWKKISETEKDKIDQMLNYLKCVLTGEEGNGYLGIGLISDDAQIVYDIHQVIRHCIAHNTKPLPSPQDWIAWTVDFNKPSQYGSEPLCEVEYRN